MKAKAEKRRRIARHLWWRNGLIWLALMGLMFLSLGMAFVPLGMANTPIGIAIAFAKASLVVLLFMEVARSRTLIRLTASAAFPFVAALFALTLADVLMRYFGR